MLLRDHARDQRPRGCQQRLTRRQVCHQRGRASGVEFAEYVVEQQYRRRTRELPHDVVAGEPQREGKGALFALRRLVPRVEIAVAWPLGCSRKPSR